jgi:hypothetical protein
MLLGIAGALLGFLSFGANIRRPIDAQIARDANGYQTPAQKEAVEAAAQRTRDTDQDGLTDYDELYVYRTSPYIKDTDSDGFDDKTEVESGNDPNCPVGKACSAPSTAPETVVPAESAPTPVSAQAAPTTEDLLQTAASLTPDQIRALLKQAGVPESNYSQLDDATLRKMFIDTVQETLAASAKPTTE